MSYKTWKNIFNNNIVVFRTSDSAWIPADPMNADYLEYVQWLFDGNTAEEWQPDTTTESVES